MNPREAAIFLVSDGRLPVSALERFDFPTEPDDDRAFATAMRIADPANDIGWSIDDLAIALGVRTSVGDRVPTETSTAAARLWDAVRRPTRLHDALYPPLPDWDTARAGATRVRDAARAAVPPRRPTIEGVVRERVEQMRASARPSGREVHQAIAAATPESLRAVIALDSYIDAEGRADLAHRLAMDEVTLAQVLARIVSDAERTLLRLDRS